jgi:hypothetical protein
LRLILVCNTEIAIRNSLARVNLWITYDLKRFGDSIQQHLSQCGLTGSRKLQSAIDVSILTSWSCVSLHDAKTCLKTQLLNGMRKA